VGTELLTVEEEAEDVDERERLRRTRISLANKGNTPWNKGRKHSPGIPVLSLVSLVLALFWQCCGHLLVSWISTGIMAGFLEVPLIDRKKGIGRNVDM